ncbi:MAG TPA: hypothetical protein VN224_12665 [Xanthomonadales bacterium]|nr:hypothetical protein [Xanthomonadales bacterium]
MRTLHALLLSPVVALVLGGAPAVAATALPTAEEAQKLVTQAVNARAVTTIVCNENKKNGQSKPAVDYLRDIGFGRVTYDVSQFNLMRAGERFVTKLQGDWEHDRTAVDPDKAAWAKMVAAPPGCWRLPLGLYAVNTVSNVRAGDSPTTALADYTFTVAPTSFGDTLVKNKSDTQVDADPLVGVPARPVFLSFYIDNAKKPLAAQAKLAFTDGAWHVVP